MMTAYILLKMFNNEIQALQHIWKKCDGWKDYNEI